MSKNTTKPVSKPKGSGSTKVVTNTKVRDSGTVSTPPGPNIPKPASSKPRR